MEHVEEVAVRVRYSGPGSQPSEEIRAFRGVPRVGDIIRDRVNEHPYAVTEVDWGPWTSSSGTTRQPRLIVTALTEKAARARLLDY